MEVDADLPSSPDRLTALMDRLAAADVVAGSPYVPGGGTMNWPSRAGGEMIISGRPGRLNP